MTKKRVTATTTYIYHFTHKDNLPSIISSGEISCDRTCKDSDVACREIAFSDLKRRRMRTRVEVPPGGTLGDYVPFYFATCSPMLLTYIDGNVTGTPERQDEIIYLVSSIEYVSGQGLQFAFPWDGVKGIGVLTEETRQWVERAMSRTSHKPPCVIRPGWYYLNKG